MEAARDPLPQNVTIILRFKGCRVAGHQASGALTVEARDRCEGEAAWHTPHGHQHNSREGAGRPDGLRTLTSPTDTKYMQSPESPFCTTTFSGKSTTFSRLATRSVNRPQHKTAEGQRRMTGVGPTECKTAAAGQGVP